MTFKEILANLSPNLQEKEEKRKEVEKKAKELEQKMEELAKNLDEIYQQLRKFDEEEKEILKKAYQVAEIMHLEVPEEYQEKINRIKEEESIRQLEELKKKNSGARSKGKFLWKPQNQKEFQAEISRALWRFSRGCGGSAGNEGVLTVKEFVGILGFNPDNMQIGEEKEVKLPNGKMVKFVKVQ